MESFVNKVIGLRPVTFFNKSPVQVFVNFPKFLRTLFYRTPPGDRLGIFSFILLFSATIELIETTFFKKIFEHILSGLSNVMNINDLKSQRQISGFLHLV